MLTVIFARVLACGGKGIIECTAGVLEAHGMTSKVCGGLGVIPLKIIVLHDATA